MRTDFSNSISLKELIDRINNDDKPLGGNLPISVFMTLEQAKILANLAVAVHGLTEAIGKHDFKKLRECTSKTQYNDVT